MKVNDEIDILIIGSSDNYGVARIGGTIIFVPDVTPGDYIRAKITKVREDVVYAEHVADLQSNSSYGNQEEDDDEGTDYPDEVMRQFEE